MWEGSLGQRAGGRQREPWSPDVQNARGTEGNGLCFRHNSGALHCEEELLGDMAGMALPPPGSLPRNR